MNFKKGIVYVFVANIINLIISLFSGFVLPSILSIDTYSSIKLFQLYITYIGIASFGFVDGMYLNHGGKTIDTINQKQVISEFNTFKIFQILVSIIAIIISIIIKNEMLLFCSIAIVPINAGGYLRNLYQAIGKFKEYSDFTNINTILIFVMNLIMLFIIKAENYRLYIIAYIIVYIVYWIIIEIKNNKLFGKQKSKFEIGFIKKDIKDGFLLMIGNFCNVIFTSIDRMFIQNLLGNIKFAFYSFAVSIENLMNVFITPISTVMYNYLCTHKEYENVKKLKRMLLIFSSIIISVIFPAKFIVNIWITKYSESLNVLFILFAAQYISIIIKCIHNNLYKSERKQNKYFIIMLIIVILSIIFDWIAYLVYGSMEAIAVATLIINIIWFIIGEFEFKEYRLKFTRYVYVAINLAIFLLCGAIDNAIIGMVIYIISITVMTIIFMKKDVKFMSKEIKKLLKNKLKRRN